MRAKLLTTVLAKRAAASPLLTGLTAYWKLDEVSDGSAPVTRLDSVGTAHLTDYNTTPSGAGLLGNCALLDAANNEYLKSGSTSLFSPGDNDFSVAIWVKATASGLNKRAIGIASGEWSLLVHPTNDAILFNIHSYGVYLQVAVNNQVGNWHLYTMKFDHTNDLMRIRVDNGVPVTKATGANYPAATTTNLLIGSDAKDYSISGGIQNAGYWSRLLTSTEEEQLWNGGDGLTYPF